MHLVSYMQHSAKILILNKEGIIKKLPISVAHELVDERAYLRLCPEKLRNKEFVHLRVTLSLGDLSHCPSAINEIAKIYKEGDLKRRVQRHRSNNFIDKKHRASRKYVICKAIDNFRDKSLWVFYIYNVTELSSQK